MLKRNGEWKWKPPVCSIDYARMFQVKMCKIVRFHDLFASDAKLNGLAEAASEYHKVAAENRELYNQVQDLKGNSLFSSRTNPHRPMVLPNKFSL